MNRSALFTVDLPVHSHLLDHRFEGKVVLPAVEAMQAVASTVRGFRPEVDLSVITHARFDKFLYIDPCAATVSASIEVVEDDRGDLHASLLTRTRSGKLGISRTLRHASLSFPLAGTPLPDPPADLVSALEGVCFEIPSEMIYRDLVPFGPSFRNIRESLFLSRDGAVLRISAPSVFSGAGEEAALGSPFPLDAAFHAACAWGQRYAGMVAFPVAIERRVLQRRTLPGSSYISRIVPVRVEEDLLTFDIWIYDERGDLYEGACGVAMRDVSAGRMKPPPWVIDSGERIPFKGMRSRALGVSVVELRTVLPLGEKALSNHEKERFERMGEARRRSYLAARLASKRLCRALRGNDFRTPAHEITTTGSDQHRPCLSLDPAVSCSVSHDDRFAVAAAARGRIGVDVERISERVMRARHLYMHETEQRLPQEAGFGKVETAVRVWTLKEAVAKAWDMYLAESWNQVRVLSVGLSESRFQLADGSIHTATHDELEGHLFTIVCEKEPP